MWKWHASIFGAVALVLGVIACGPIRVVDEGHVGLVTRYGKAEDGVRPPGLAFINGFTQHLIEVETRVRPVTFKDIDAASAELQSVRLTGTLNYGLAREKIVLLYRTVGLDYQSRVLNAALHATAKAVLPEYPVNDILVKREEISTRIVERLNAQLDEYGIHVVDLFLENVAFSAEFAKAIESKQVAAQDAERERQVLAQRRLQAEQAVVVAQGEAEANRLRSESLTPAILRDKELSKWDGKLPQVMGDATPFVQVR